MLLLHDVPFVPAYYFPTLTYIFCLEHLDFSTYLCLAVIYYLSSIDISYSMLNFFFAFITMVMPDSFHFHISAFHIWAASHHYRLLILRNKDCL